MSVKTAVKHWRQETHRRVLGAEEKNRSPKCIASMQTFRAKTFPLETVFFLAGQEEGLQVSDK